MLEAGKQESAELALREQRAHPRYPFSGGAEVAEVNTEARINARVSDLGRGGCYAESMRVFPSGASVKIHITKDANTFTAQAKVVHECAGKGMGLMFTVIEPEQRWVLEKWLAELRGELPEHQRAEGAKNAGSEQGTVLNELITALMRKRVLTDAEGRALLQKLLR